MNPKLFHRDIGIPARLVDLWDCRAWKLTYSQHALQAVLTDRYGLPKKMPKEIVFARSHVFEVEEVATEVRDCKVVASKVSRVCIRISSDECDFVGPIPNMDLCLCLVQGNRPGERIVTTCWFNERNDTHATLDASKYSRP